LGSNTGFAIKYGLYAGEIIVVAAWMSWGAGWLLRRLSTGLLLSGSWYASSWLGFIAAIGSRFWEYTEYMPRWLCEAPIFLALTAILLGLGRILANWRFDLSLPSPDAKQFTLLQLFWLLTVWGLALSCPTILPAVKRMLDDSIGNFAYAVLHGSIANSVAAMPFLLALASCLLVVFSIMRGNVRPVLLLPAPVAVVGGSWYWTTGMGGPGAGFGYDYIAVVIGLTATSFIIAASLVWRAAGYRLYVGRAAD
jgi:hypothetical protein